MRRTLSLLLAVTAVAIVSASTARADDWSKTFSVSAKPHVTLSVDNGRLTIQPGAVGQVSVHVTTTGWSIPGDVQVIPSQNGNDIQVQVKQKNHWMSFSHGTVSVDVTVPAQSDLDMSTGNGRISASSISGDLRLGTGNGRIEATGLHGNLSMHTGNGGIEASGLDGSLEARTGNGGVHVSGRFDVLQAESGRGSMEASALPGSKMSSSWEVRTGVGSVTLRLPANFSADLEGSTGVGHVNVNFPVNTTSSMTGGSVHGQIGKGGPTLRVHTGVGSVNIEHSGE